MESSPLPISTYLKTTAVVPKLCAAGRHDKPTEVPWDVSSGLHFLTFSGTTILAGLRSQESGGGHLVAWSCGHIFIFWSPRQRTIKEGYCDQGKFENCCSTGRGKAKQFWKRKKVRGYARGTENDGEGPAERRVELSSLENGGNSGATFLFNHFLNILVSTRMIRNLFPSFLLHLLTVWSWIYVCISNYKNGRSNSLQDLLEHSRSSPRQSTILPSCRIFQNVVCWLDSTGVGSSIWKGAPISLGLISCRIQGKKFSLYVKLCSTQIMLIHKDNALSTPKPRKV